MSLLSKNNKGGSRQSSLSDFFSKGQSTSETINPKYDSNFQFKNIRSSQSLPKTVLSGVFNKPIATV